MKKEPFSRHAPLPPALVRLAAVLADIARNEEKAPAADDANGSNKKEPRNAANPRGRA